MVIRDIKRKYTNHSRLFCFGFHNVGGVGVDVQFSEAVGKDLSIVGHYIFLHVGVVTSEDVQGRSTCTV